MIDESTSFSELNSNELKTFNLRTIKNNNQTDDLIDSNYEKLGRFNPGLVSRAGTAAKMFNHFNKLQQTSLYLIY